MGLIGRINDKLENRRVVNRYGSKRRKGAVVATRKYTEDYEFEEDFKKPGLIKRISHLSW